MEHGCEILVAVPGNHRRIRGVPLEQRRWSLMIDKIESIHHCFLLNAALSLSALSPFLGLATSSDHSRVHWFAAFSYRTLLICFKTSPFASVETLNRIEHLRYFFYEAAKEQHISWLTFIYENIHKLIIDFILNNYVKLTNSSLVINNYDNSKCSCSWGFLPVIHPHLLQLGRLINSQISYLQSLIRSSKLKIRANILYLMTENTIKNNKRRFKLFLFYKKTYKRKYFLYILIFETLKINLK